MFRKIAWQLTSSYIVVILFSMGILGFYMLKALEEYFIHELERGLHNQAALVESIWAPAMEEGSGDRDRKRLVLLAQRLSWEYGSRIRVFDVHHHLVVDTGGAEDLSLPDRPALQKAFAGQEHSDIGPDPSNPSASLVSLAYPVRVRRPSLRNTSGAEETVEGVVYLTRATAYVRPTLESVRELFLVGTVISLLISGTLSLFLSHYISGPLREITAAAEKMAGGDLSIQVPTYPRNEIGELGEQFNNMALQLGASTSLVMEEKNKLAAVLSHMADGVLMMDAQGRVVVSNPSANEMLSAMSASGEQNTLQSLREGFSRTLSDGTERREEVPLAGGKVARAIYSPVRSEKGEILGIVVILHDITELRRLAELKSEFVSNVSHELKTPIASIKGLAEILLDGALQEKEARRFLTSIDREVNRMARLVKDLLSLSKIESGVVRMESRPFDLGALVDEVTVGFSERARGQRVSIEAEMGTSEQPEVWALGDRDRVEQVLVNLLDNALRYSPSDSCIRIHVYTIDDLTCRVDVQDEGIGIPPAELERIFNRFHRVDKARTREQGGTGLGLAIARQIVERLHGRIWALSDGQRGTRFSFTVPRPIVDPAMTHDPEPSARGTSPEESGGERDST